MYADPSDQNVCLFNNIDKRKKIDLKFIQTLAFFTHPNAAVQLLCLTAWDLVVLWNGTSSNKGLVGPNIRRKDQQILEGNFGRFPPLGNAHLTVFFV